MGPLRTALQERFSLGKPHGSASTFRWPKSNHLSHIPFLHILRVVQPPRSISTCQEYSFSNDDMNAVEEKWSVHLNHVRSTNDGSE